METAILPAVAGFAVAGTITPGPNNIMVMVSGANHGFRRTVPHLLGITAGVSVLITIAGAELMAALDTTPGFRTGLMAVSIIYLLYLAWKITNASAPEASGANGQPLTFLQAAAFQWVNPKVWAHGLSAITLYAPDSSFHVGDPGCQHPRRSRTLIEFTVGMDRYIRTPLALNGDTTPGVQYFDGVAARRIPLPCSFTLERFQKSARIALQSSSWKERSARRRQTNQSDPTVSTMNRKSPMSPPAHFPPVARIQSTQCSNNCTAANPLNASVSEPVARSRFATRSRYPSKHETIQLDAE